MPTIIKAIVDDSFLGRISVMREGRLDKPDLSTVIREGLVRVLEEWERGCRERADREQRLTLNALRAEKAARLDRRAKRHAAKRAGPESAPPDENSSAR